MSLQSHLRVFKLYLKIWLAQTSWVHGRIIQPEIELKRPFLLFLVSFSQVSNLGRGSVLFEPSRSMFRWSATTVYLDICSSNLTPLIHKASAFSSPAQTTQLVSGWRVRVSTAMSRMCTSCPSWWLTADLPRSAPQAPWPFTSAAATQVRTPSDAGHLHDIIVTVIVSAPKKRSSFPLFAFGRR